MIQEHIQWRKEYEVTRLRSPENHGDAFPQLKGYWPGELHGVDRDGLFPTFCLDFACLSNLSLFFLLTP